MGVYCGLAPVSIALNLVFKPDKINTPRNRSGLQQLAGFQQPGAVGLQALFQFGCRHHLDLFCGQVNNRKMFRFTVFGLVLVLSGCGGEKIAQPRLTTAARLAHAETQLAKPPVPRTYTIQGNQIQVVELPVADTSGFVDQQRCFIYRDVEFKTSSISCESRPEVVISTSN